MVRRRTASYKVLSDKTFTIDSSPEYDGYQRLASGVYKSFDKTSRYTTTNTGTRMFSRIINSLTNYPSSSLENLRDVKYIVPSEKTIGGADLADLQLISKYNEGVILL